MGLGRDEKMKDYSTTMPQETHRLELTGRERLTVSGV